MGTVWIKILDVIQHGCCCACSTGAAISGKANVGPDEWDLLERLLRWPAASLFPALDIARLLVLDDKTATRLAAKAGPLELSPLGVLCNPIQNKSKK